jgi:hypothetical protein
MLLKFLISRDFMIRLRRFLSIPTLYIKDVCSVGLVLKIESNKASTSALISFSDANSKLLFRMIERKDYSSTVFTCKTLRMFEEEGKFL